MFKGVRVCCLTASPVTKDVFVKIRYAWIADKRGKTITLRTFRSLTSYELDEQCDVTLLELPLESIVSLVGYMNDGKLCVQSYVVINKPLIEKRVNYLTNNPTLNDFVENYAWFYRNPRFKKIILLQHVVLKLIRRFLNREGFIELQPPVIAPTSDPGLRGAKKLVTTLYGDVYELSSSLIMYKQISVGLFKKIFYVARNVREEPLDHIETGRHLVEFTQIDVEVAFASISDVMNLAERLIYYVLKRVRDDYSDLVESIGFRKEVPVWKPPFPKLTYDEALVLAFKKGYEVKWGRELPFVVESLVADEYGSPVWVTNFPTVARGFYYLEKRGDDRYNEDFNLLLPGGLGEVVDGGSREYRYEKLIEKIRRIHGEDVAKYEWFLKYIKEGAIPPSSGWGLGLERFIKFITGCRHIGYVTYPPRLPGYIG